MRRAAEELERLNREEARIRREEEEEKMRGDQPELLDLDNDTFKQLNAQ